MSLLFPLEVQIQLQPAVLGGRASKQGKVYYPRRLHTDDSDMSAREHKEIDRPTSWRGKKGAKELHSRGHSSSSCIRSCTGRCGSTSKCSNASLAENIFCFSASSTSARRSRTGYRFLLLLGGFTYSPPSAFIRSLYFAFCLRFPLSTFDFLSHFFAINGGNSRDKKQHTPFFTRVINTHLMSYEGH